MVHSKQSYNGIKRIKNNFETPDTEHMSKNNNMFKVRYQKDINKAISEVF